GFAAGLDPGRIKRYFSLSIKGHPIKVFLEKEYMKGLGRYLGGDRFFLRCQALNASCFIDPSGAVYACGMYDARVGDLRRSDFNLDALWNAKAVLSIRKDISEKKCPGCWSPCEAYPAILGSIVPGCSMK
ncbi:MAG: SPASM domain-containing protein, partial [Candidatus Omnitrophota bacterium]